MANLQENDWREIKCILHYLSGTTTHDLMLTLANSNYKFLLRAYNDFDWVNDPNKYKSTSRSCAYFGPKLVSHSSKKQALVTRSGMETN